LVFPAYPYISHQPTDSPSILIFLFWWQIKIAADFTSRLKHGSTTQMTIYQLYLLIIELVEYE